MSDTVKPVSLTVFLQDKTIQQRIADAFNKDERKAGDFITSVLSLVGSDDNLKNVDRATLINACLSAAAMHLPVNKNLGLAYIIPYKGEAQLQVGYKGFIQLAMRSTQFKTISATPIYKGQIVAENPLTGYEFDFTVKDSDEVVGYAAYFKLVNGFEKTLYMTVDELKKHGRRYSQTFKKGYGLWEDNFDAMASKTVIKLLLSRYAPLSIEMQTAVLADQGVIYDNNIKYPDNKKLSLEDNNKEKEEARLKEWIETADTKEKLAEANEQIYQLGNADLIDLYEEKLKSFDVEITA